MGSDMLVMQSHNAADHCYTPMLQQSWKGVYWFHFVRPRRFVLCEVCFKIQKFVILANSSNL